MVVIIIIDLSIRFPSPVMTLSSRKQQSMVVAVLSRSLDILFSLQLSLTTSGGLHPSAPAHAGPRRSDGPQCQIGHIDPHGVLHANDSSVPLWVFADVHLPENAKQRQPQDAQDAFPDEKWQVKTGTEDERGLEHARSQKVDQRCEGSQARRHLGVHPFRVGVDMLLPRIAEIHSIQPDDSESQYKLKEAQEEVGERFSRAASTTHGRCLHFGGVLCLVFSGFADFGLVNTNLQESQGEEQHDRLE